ncbi:MAG: hypothetical protein EDM03_15020 [Porphyrobacter sp. IPPAS B-1204]|nr:MAG: hypothetical protein EDM03_15020 [Porphyrobacter sp. IPPAS B-1204]
MQTIRYSRIKLGIGFAACVILALIGVWLAVNFTGKGGRVGGGVAFSMVLLSPFPLRYLADNRIALIGKGMLDFHGMLGTRRVRFEEIVDIDIESRQALFMTARHLKIVRSGGYGWGWRIAEILLEDRAGGLEDVLDLIEKGPSALPQRRAVPAACQPEPLAANGRVGGFGRKGS